jgi:hypothetical protein
MKKMWWVWLVLGGALALVLYEVYKGNLTVAKCLTIGPSQKQIVAQAPAAAATAVCCCCTKDEELV